MMMMVPKIRKEEEAASDDIASNEDLLTLILLCLPVKSLLRFKSVSKNWLSLITSAHFYRLQRNRFSKDISGLLLKPVYKGRRFSKDISALIYPRYEFIPLGEDDGAPPIWRSSPMSMLDFVQTVGTLQVIQSCNGLLLCRREMDRDYEYFVINPTTKEYIKVPVTRVLDSALSVNLVFDPRKSPHFKLVCAFYSYPSHKSTCGGGSCNSFAIYSSETGVMRLVDGCLCRPELNRELDYHQYVNWWNGPTYKWLDNWGVYWNGAFNWIDMRNGSGLYFNVDEERVGIFPRPPRSSEEGTRRFIRYIGENNDHLHLIETANVLLTTCNVYEMDKGYSGWFVKFRVDLQPVLSSFPEYVVPVASPFGGLYGVAASFGVLGVVRKDGDGKSFLVLSIPNKVIRFDLEDGSFLKLCDFPSANDYVYDCWDSFQFTGSLHCL